jgi:hypothetical protein
MVAVPNIAPETPALKRIPFFFISRIGFCGPIHSARILPLTSRVYLIKKFRDWNAHESQMYEWLPWIGHYSDKVPKDKGERIKMAG